jgi:hypothetical protein
MKLYLNELVTIDEAKIVNITFLGPVYPNEIFSVASHHDIGLALEPGRDINNQIALSNKIFTYLLAGNAVIFSATPAQKLFYEENRGIGSLYSCGNTHELTAILKNYLYHPELLLEAKRNAVKLAGIKYNWEVESKKLLVIIQAALDIA